MIFPGQGELRFRIVNEVAAALLRLVRLLVLAAAAESIG